MKHLLSLWSAGLLLSGGALGQDLANAGATITVQPGAQLYVGPAGLVNQAGSTITNGGTLRVDGPLTNQAGATLDLGAGALEARGDLYNTGTLLPSTGVVTFTSLTCVPFVEPRSSMR